MPQFEKGCALWGRVCDLEPIPKLGAPRCAAPGKWIEEVEHSAIPKKTPTDFLWGLLV